MNFNSNGKIKLQRDFKCGIIIGSLNYFSLRHRNWNLSNVAVVKIQGQIRDQTPDPKPDINRFGHRHNLSWYQNLESWPKQVISVQNPVLTFWPLLRLEARHKLRKPSWYLRKPAKLNMTYSLLYQVVLIENE